MHRLNQFYHRIMTIICTFIGVFLYFIPLFKILYRVKAYGVKNIPKGGGLIAANHASFYDPPMIGGALYPRRLCFMARDSLFKTPIGGWFMRHVGCYPVKRGKGNSEIFKLIPELVKQGNIAVIFPEGTRTRDGELQPGQLGAGLLVQKSNCPVIPTYVHGTYDIWNINMEKPRRRGRAYVVFGKAITFEHLKDLDKKAQQQQIVKEIMDAIAKLKKEFLNIPKQLEKSDLG